jgi:hypothetical protein
MGDSQDALAAIRREDERLKQKLRAAQTRDEALDTAILAAENALKALSLARNAEDKTRFRTRAKESMGEAESIKKNPTWRPTSTQPVDRLVDVAEASTVSPVSGVAKYLKEPRSTRTLTTREKIILARATFLNGTKFPMWETAPSTREFELIDGQPFVCVSQRSGIMCAC